MGARLLKLGLLPGGEFTQVFIDILQGAVLCNELCRANFSNAVYAGDIIGGISANGKHVNYLRRLTDSPFLTKLLHAQKLAFRPGFSGL